MRIVVSWILPEGWIVCMSPWLHVSLGCFLRLLDLNADPFLLVTRLRFVPPSLSLGIVEVCRYSHDCLGGFLTKENFGSLLCLDQDLGADQPQAKGLGSLVSVH